MTSRTPSAPKRRRGADSAQGASKRARGASDAPVVLPRDLLCPITMELFIDPVATADGHVYERRAIADWFKARQTSPVTNAPLTDTRLTPVNILRVRCDALRAAYPELTLSSYYQEVDAARGNPERAEAAAAQLREVLARIGRDNPRILVERAQQQLDRPHQLVPVVDALAAVAATSAAARSAAAPLLKPLAHVNGVAVLRFYAAMAAQQSPFAAATLEVGAMKLAALHLVASTHVPEACAYVGRLLATPAGLDAARAHDVLASLVIRRRSLSALEALTAWSKVDPDAVRPHLATLADIMATAPAEQVARVAGIARVVGDASDAVLGAVCAALNRKPRTLHLMSAFVVLRKARPEAGHGLTAATLGSILGADWTTHDDIITACDCLSQAMNEREDLQRALRQEREDAEALLLRWLQQNENEYNLTQFVLYTLYQMINSGCERPAQLRRILLASYRLVRIWYDDLEVMQLCFWVMYAALEYGTNLCDVLLRLELDNCALTDATGRYLLHMEPVSARQLLGFVRLLKDADETDRVRGHLRTHAQVLQQARERFQGDAEILELLQGIL